MLCRYAIVTYLIVVSICRYVVILSCVLCIDDVVGNAAFYSSALYEAMLAIKLPVQHRNNPSNNNKDDDNIISSPFYGLLQCLQLQSLGSPNRMGGVENNSTEEEKMRSNAAGAIGNLVRNGASLCAELIRIRVPEQLIEMTLYEACVAPQRIALFSLGTMCMYASCRQVLMSHNPSILDLIGSLSSRQHAGNSISGDDRGDNNNNNAGGGGGSGLDETVAKYLIRLKQKLKAPAITPHAHTHTHAHGHAQPTGHSAGKSSGGGSGKSTTDGRKTEGNKVEGSSRQLKEKDRNVKTNRK